jgi:hypothetical protein
MAEIVDSMDLTAAEVEMILERRAKQERKRKADEQAIALLEIAAGYGKWLITTGNGSTYSTFCDDCETIDTSILQNRSEAYKFVWEIVQLAQRYATGHGSKIYP